MNNTIQRAAAGWPGFVQGVEDYARIQQLGAQSGQLRRAEELRRSGAWEVPGLQLPEASAQNFGVRQGQLPQQPEPEARAVPEVSVGDVRPIEDPRQSAAPAARAPVIDPELDAIEAIELEGKPLTGRGPAGRTGTPEAILEIDGQIRSWLRSVRPSSRREARGEFRSLQNAMLGEIGRVPVGRPNRITNYFASRPGSWEAFTQRSEEEQIQIMQSILGAEPEAPAEVPTEEPAPATAPTAEPDFAAAQQTVQQGDQASSTGAPLPQGTTDRLYEQTSPTGQPFEALIDMDDFYLVQDPNALTFEMQHLMQHRRTLEQWAQNYAYIGSPEAMAQYQGLVSDLRNVDLALYNAQGMQGIQELTVARDPRRLSAVWSANANMNVQIVPRQDGLFDIVVNGRTRHEGWSLDEVTSQAQMAFSAQARQRYMENQQARFQSALDVEEHSQKKMAETMANIVEAYQTHGLEVAKIRARNADLEVIENPTMGGPPLVVRVREDGSVSVMPLEEPVPATSGGFFRGDPTPGLPMRTGQGVVLDPVGGVTQTSPALGVPQQPAAQSAEEAPSQVGDYELPWYRQMFGR